MTTRMSYSVACDNGIVRPGDYFLTQSYCGRKVIVPSGKSGVKYDQMFEIGERDRTLWQLGEDFKLWGQPTKKSLVLNGKIGARHGPNILHSVVRELFGMPWVFQTVRSCALKQGYYMGSHRGIMKLCDTYQAPDDASHWLATRCTSFILRDLDIWSNLFEVNQGKVSPKCLHELRGSRALCASNQVRPVATAAPYALLYTSGRDGSREKPWEFMC